MKQLIEDITPISNTPVLLEASSKEPLSCYVWCVQHSLSARGFTENLEKSVLILHYRLENLGVSIVTIKYLLEIPLSRMNSASLKLDSPYHYF